MSHDVVLAGKRVASPPELRPGEYILPDEAQAVPRRDGATNEPPIDDEPCRAVPCIALDGRGSVVRLAVVEAPMVAEGTVFDSYEGTQLRLQGSRHVRPGAIREHVITSFRDAQGIEELHLRGARVELSALDDLEGSPELTTAPAARSHHEGDRGLEQLQSLRHRREILGRATVDQRDEVLRGIVRRDPEDLGVAFERLLKASEFDLNVGAASPGMTAKVSVGQLVFSIWRERRRPAKR
ncbi:hypothetical protein WMF27_45020 [Sorangium sp. So ce281]|uniref:hypothetical protein n=1 Tax=unclassified Sorangium TaxID=2621164 RepID=UPI003F5E8D31